MTAVMRSAPCVVPRGVQSAITQLRIADEVCGGAHYSIAAAPIPSRLTSR